MTVVQESHPSGTPRERSGRHHTDRPLLHRLLAYTTSRYQRDAAVGVKHLAHSTEDDQ